MAPLLDLDWLGKKRVSVIGCGSGGSRVATELARCGLTEFDVFDPEVLAVENVSRHVGGKPQVGRPKVDVVRDSIIAISPQARVRAHRQDIFDDQDATLEMLRGTGLIVDGTGRANVGHVLSKFASALSTPATFAGVYPRGVGGFALAFDPTVGDPCYTCVFTRLKAMEQDHELTPPQRLNYTTEATQDELVAEPSLSISVWYVVLLQVRLSLELLMKGAPERSTRPLEPLPGHFIFWANDRWADFFKKPLTYVKVNSPKDPNCYSCGRGAGPVSGSPGIGSGPEVH